MLDTKSFREIVDSFYKHLLETSNEVTGIKLAEDKWSLREIIGHLVDSASNSHQRFVRLQFGDLPDFPVYGPEEWVRTQKYNSMNWEVLVALWYNYNCLLLNVIENIDETAYKNVWVKVEDTIPLDELVRDYYRHLELHIKHFNDREKER